MPSFKPKVKKKIDVDKNSLITLDNKHNEKLEEYFVIENVDIPDLIKQKKQIKQRLKNQNLNIEKRLEYEDILREISKKIASLKKEKNKYLLDNSKYIFEYDNSYKWGI